MTNTANTAYWLNIGNWIYGSSGNIGIGTDAPATKLDVAGEVRATNYVTTSDERLKTNVEEVSSSAWEKLLLLRPVLYNWNEL